jgi:putative transposase
MPDWPHSPSHRVIQGGTYIVTASTYRKEALFGSKSRLDLLCEALLRLSSEHGWKLQAWAVFPNHYHFVAQSTSPNTLRGMTRCLHSLTARAVNNLDEQPGRRVWFQYWDTLITNQRSYFARLRYVHENAVRHSLVKRAANYPWCSATWFEQKAEPSLRKTVSSFACDRLAVPDAFEVTAKDIFNP